MLLCKFALMKKINNLRLIARVPCFMRTNYKIHQPRSKMIKIAMQDNGKKHAKFLGYMDNQFP